MLKLALIGYGKMGKMVADLADSYNARVVSIIDTNVKDAFPSITAESLADVDVCIDFTHPCAVFDNIRRVAELKKNLVVGTTGWHDLLPEVKKIVQASGIGLIYGANFSIGMNLFLRLVEQAAKEFDHYSEYDVCGYELHHNQKADSPSGTARSLCSSIIANSSRKSSPAYEKLDRKINPEELHFASIRGGCIPGTHTVLFDSEAETIELTHRARSRSCFAVGALRAASWIAGKKGIFNIKDMIQGLL